MYKYPDLINLCCREIEVLIVHFPTSEQPVPRSSVKYLYLALGSPRPYTMMYAHATVPRGNYILFFTFTLEMYVNLK